MHHRYYRRELIAAAAASALGLLVLVVNAHQRTPPQETTVGIRLNPNQASLEDLSAIPGVGRHLAWLVVQGRPYRTLNDLTQAVGPERARALAPYLTLR